jgi:hypothetical protein
MALAFALSTKCAKMRTIAYYERIIDRRLSDYEVVAAKR